MERASGRWWLETSRRFAARMTHSFDAAEQIVADFMQVETKSELDTVLSDICTYLGCSYFALTHHVDFMGSPGLGLRVHNYPDEWAHWFDTQRLGLHDPVHRASQRTASGFVWRDMGRLVTLAPGDKAVLARARRHGIGDGLTVPAHVPGDAHGSCSFAWRKGEAPDARALVFAQSIANFAFEAARRLHGPADPPRRRLTDRQRECLLWAARGKTDWEIGRIVGLRHLTVVEHIRNARARYDAATRAMLVVRALFDGTLHFSEIAER
jgi:DNA-binding CsgD family transcriptional regulator